jgi:hypothetical protein
MANNTLVDGFLNVYGHAVYYLLPFMTQLDCATVLAALEFQQRPDRQHRI